MNDKKLSMKNQRENKKKKKYVEKKSTTEPWPARHLLVILSKCLVLFVPIVMFISVTFFFNLRHAINQIICRLVSDVT